MNPLRYYRLGFKRSIVFLCLLSLNQRAVHSQILGLTVGEFGGDVYIAWSGSLDVDPLGAPPVSFTSGEVSLGDDGGGGGGGFRLEAFPTNPSQLSIYFSSGVPPAIITSIFSGSPGDWVVEGFDDDNKVRGTGDPVALAVADDSTTSISLPQPYISGESIEGCIIHPGQSFATLGVNNDSLAAAFWRGSDGRTVQQVLFRTKQDAFSTVPKPCVSLLPTHTLELTVGEINGNVYIAWSGSLDVGSLGEPTTSSSGERSVGDDSSGGYRLIAHPTNPSMLSSYNSNSSPMITGTFSGPPGDWLVEAFDGKNVTGAGDPVALIISSDSTTHIILPRDYISGESMEGCIIHVRQSFTTLDVNDDTTATASWIGSDGTTVQKMTFKTQQDAFADSGIPQPCLPLAATTTTAAETVVSLSTTQATTSTTQGGVSSSTQTSTSTPATTQAATSPLSTQSAAAKTFSSTEMATSVSINPDVSVSSAMASTPSTSMSTTRGTSSSTTTSTVSTPATTSQSTTPQSTWISSQDAASASTTTTNSLRGATSTTQAVTRTSGTSRSKSNKGSTTTTPMEKTTTGGK